MSEIVEGGLVIHELIGGNVAGIGDYLDLYGELFPEYIRYVPLMRRRAEMPVNESANEKWHQWLLLINQKPVGIMGFLYNKIRNVGVLMDFAIQREARSFKYMGNQRLAEGSLQLAMRQLIQDSRDNGHDVPLFMIAEVEHEQLLKKYTEYGYLKFPVDYCEPPYPLELIEASVESSILDKMIYKPMFLGAFQIPGHPFDPNNPEIIKTALFTMLVDHYGLSVDHWLTKKNLSEIFI